LGARRRNYARFAHYPRR